MKIPAPVECGLPEKFGSWRSGQEQVVDVMITSPKRVTTVCAPTGFGKSAPIVAGAILSRRPTCIVTASRGLQDQYMRDFASVGMVDLRGRSNYPCELREDYSCEEGYAARCPYKGTPACPSSAAEMRAATSSLVVTNYDKWTAAKKFGTGMSHFTQVIFDEGDQSVDALCRTMQVVLGHREIEEILRINFLMGEEAESFANWRPWAAEAKEEAKKAAADAYAKIQCSDPKPSWVKHYTHMRNLVRRLSILSVGRDNDWVVEEVREPHAGFKFDPIRPGKFAEAHLLLRIPKVIFISATIRPKTMFMLNIRKDDFNFLEFDSDFDPRRCPIYYVPVMRVDKRNEGNMKVLWNRMDMIAARRRDRKGIIHTISYQRQEDVINSSRFWESMIINEKGEAPTEKIEEFMEADPASGKLLVSPSVGVGYDFKDDLCRWQFICKIPFEPPSKIVKAREAEDKEYRAYKAMQYMVQAFGRDMRSKTDWSERFICDEHLDWFLPRFGHLAPRHFHNFFKRVDVLPQPPKREEMM